MTELFPARPPEGCTPAYRNLFQPDHPRAAAAKQRCEEMWRVFEPLADSQFLIEFPVRFHQRWFEMYLGASLLSAGIEATAPDPGPDFLILANGRRVFIEAVCATAGHPLHEDTVQEPVYEDADGKPIASQVPHDQITLRIASVVRAKLDAFDRYRSRGIVSEGDACIMAVNIREIPHAWGDPKEFLYRALYGNGNRVLEIDSKTRRIVSQGREHRTLLARTGGALEAVAPLLDPTHADLCGVLGSSADVGNMPDLLGDDFLLMPHAMGRVPLPDALIGRGVQLSLRPSSWTIEETDYGAPDPRPTESFTFEHEGVRFKGEWEISGRELCVRLGDQSSATIFRKGSGDPFVAAQEIAREMLLAYGIERCSKARVQEGD